MRAISTVQATPTRTLFHPFRAHGALLQGLAVPAPPRPHHPTVTHKTRHAGDWAIA